LREKGREDVGRKNSAQKSLICGFGRLHACALSNGLWIPNLLIVALKKRFNTLYVSVATLKVCSDAIKERVDMLKGSCQCTKMRLSHLTFSSS
jgi:hypothetical protein